MGRAGIMKLKYTNTTGMGIYRKCLQVRGCGGGSRQFHKSPSGKIGGASRIESKPPLPINVSMCAMERRKETT